MGSASSRGNCPWEIRSASVGPSTSSMTSARTSTPWMAAILGWFSDQRLGFAGEACEPVGIGGEGLGQDLERDLAVELGVCGAPDFAHAALAELGGDAVVRDGRLRAHSAVSG